MSSVSNDNETMEPKITDDYSLRQQNQNMLDSDFKGTKNAATIDSEVSH